MKNPPCLEIQSIVKMASLPKAVYGFNTIPTKCLYFHTHRNKPMYIYPVIIIFVSFHHSILFYYRRIILCLLIVDGSLGFFEFVDTVNKAVLNMCIQISIWTSYSILREIPVRRKAWL